MIRTLITFVILGRLRARAPQLFDGARALAAINACIEQDLADLTALAQRPELSLPRLGELVPSPPGLRELARYRRG